MRTSIALLFFAFAATCSGQLVIPNLNNVGTLLSQLGQLQNFVENLGTYLPQLQAALSSSEFQGLKDKITAIVFQQFQNNGGFPGIKDKLQQLLQQYGHLFQGSRIDLNNILNSLVSGLVSAAPSLIFSLLGKREAVEERINLNQLLSLAQSLNVQKLIPQLQGLLSGGKLQQLQSAFQNLIISAASSDIDLKQLATSIRDLIVQFVPQLGLMRIDWEQIGLTALNGLLNNLPNLAVTGLLSLFGKRALIEEPIDIQQLLASLPLDKMSQLVQAALNAKNEAISKVLATIRDLLQKFFPQYQTRISFDLVAQHLLSSITSALPLFSNLSNLFGKRSINQLLALADSLNINTLIPQLQGLLSKEKLQELQQKFLNLLLSAASNNLQASNIGQLIHSLVSQFVPQIGQQRGINWEQIGQTALNGLAGALPNLIGGALSALSLFG